MVLHCVFGLGCHGTVSMDLDLVGYVRAVFTHALTHLHPAKPAQTNQTGFALPGFQTFCTSYVVRSLLSLLTLLFDRDEFSVPLQSHHLGRCQG